ATMRAWSRMAACQSASAVASPAPIRATAALIFFWAVIRAASSGSGAPCWRCDSPAVTRPRSSASSTAVRWAASSARRARSSAARVAAAKLSPRSARRCWRFAGFAGAPSAGSPASPSSPAGGSGGSSNVVPLPVMSGAAPCCCPSSVAMGSSWLRDDAEVVLAGFRVPREFDQPGLEAFAVVERLVHIGGLELQHAGRLVPGGVEFRLALPSGEAADLNVIADHDVVTAERVQGLEARRDKDSLALGHGITVAELRRCVEDDTALGLPLLQRETKNKNVIERRRPWDRSDLVLGQPLLQPLAA